MGEVKMEEVLLKEFPECQKCGSTELMMGDLGKEMEQEGHIRPGMSVGIDEIGGPVLDPAMTSKMLTDAIRPGHFALRDVCMGCGFHRVVKISRKPIAIQLGPAGTVPLGTRGEN